MKGTYYCDESGNTGTNWIDKEQSFFVYGGWLIPDKSKDAVLSGLSEIFAKYPGSEIKAKRFFKMGKANEYFKRLFGLMLHTPAFPIFTITDKSYIVAPKIIETFFDPAYNKSLRYEISWDISLKKQLSEVIRESTVIFDFAKLIRSGTLTLEEIRNIKFHLSQSFLLTPNISNNIIHISDNELQEMLHEFDSPNTSRSLTVPALNHLMQVLQKFSENYDLETTIVHDNLRGYDDWLDEMRDIYLSQGEMQILQGQDFQWYSKLPNITELSLKDSKDILLLQIADLLCGFLLRCFQKVDKNITLTAIEKEIMQHLFVLHDEMFTWDYIFPEDMITKYLNVIGLNVSDPFPINHMLLDTGFLKYIK